MAAKENPMQVQLKLAVGNYTALKTVAVCGSVTASSSPMLPSALRKKGRKFDSSFNISKRSTDDSGLNIVIISANSTQVYNEDAWQLQGWERGEVCKLLLT